VISSQPAPFVVRLAPSANLSISLRISGEPTVPASSSSLPLKLFGSLGLSENESKRLDNARASFGATEITHLMVRPQIKGETYMIAKRTRMLLTTALLLGVVSVYAQAENVPFIKVSIPFNFTVGSQTLPAGDYTISESDVHPQSVIWLQSSDGKYVAVVGTHPSYALDPSARTQLIFQHSGGEYFLSQLWTLGSTSGREVRLSNRADELARKGSSGDVATIVAEASFSH